jgi:hypothetical protein
MNEDFKKRTESFRWPTKQDLYNYFSKTYNLKQEVIDECIESAKQRFQLRKGLTIKTQELWEKVGSELESKLSPKKKKN